MKIAILTTNKSGVLYKTSLVLKRHKYKIEQKQIETVDSSNFLYTFILSDNGNYDGLIDSIIEIPDVIEVKTIEQNVENDRIEIEQKQLQKLLIEIAQNLIELYPDFVEMIRDINQNPEMSQQSILEVGQYVGIGLIEQEKFGRMSPKNISIAIKKIVLPAIEPFAIADKHKDGIEIYANPLCSNQKIEDEPTCYFLTGMIRGLLSSVQNSPEITVKETSCKASGGNSCIFTIN